MRTIIAFRTLQFALVLWVPRRKANGNFETAPFLPHLHGLSKSQIFLLCTGPIALRTSQFLTLFLTPLEQIYLPEKSLILQVKNGTLKSKTFSGSRKEQRMFAHLMLNYGVMMTHGCVAGYVCSFSYYDEQK
ncbi:MAG TPA: hypothetical protein PK892_14065 [Bacteroidales bacterium]|nr:hypothetical protein [Bacteroidales bacterium]